MQDIERKQTIPNFLAKYLPRPKFLEENKITIAIIKRYVEQIIVKYGKGKIDKVYLFGSYSRGEEKRTSDIDLRFETKPGLSLFDIGNFIVN